MYCSYHTFIRYPTTLTTTFNKGISSSVISSISKSLTYNKYIYKTISIDKHKLIEYRYKCKWCLFANSRQKNNKRLYVRFKFVCKFVAFYLLFLIKFATNVAKN